MSSPRKRAQSATRYSTRSQSPQKVDTTAAKKSTPKRQPSVHSEHFESEHTIDAGDQQPKSTKSARGAHAEKTLIDQKLGKYHFYLREEDRHEKPDFKGLYDEITEFIANLAGSKAMFDSRLYNDVKSMVREYSEKWAEDEQEAPAKKRKNSNTSSGRSTAISPSAASRIFSPGPADDDRFESPQTTISTSAGSPIKKKTVAFEEEDEEIEGGYLTPHYDKDEDEDEDDDDDGELLEFAPSILAAAEKKALAEEVDEDELSTPKPTRTTRRTASKRRISDAVDLDTPHKRRKHGQNVPASTISRAAELSTVKKASTCPVKPGGKQKRASTKAVVQTIELDDDDDDDGIGSLVAMSPRKVKAGRTPRRFN
ncbi:MAG: hypothetical protein Q9203_004574, partial [Teloschistes exilis]